MASILSRSLSKSLRISRWKSLNIQWKSHFSSTQHSPLMLTNLPPVIYPNLFLVMRNLITRLTITNTLDRSFAIKPFCQGARQALTVVSHLIGQEQFDDLDGFVSKEVIEEVKGNFPNLSIQQKQQIPVHDSEIIFSYPYLIDLIFDRPTNTRLIEVMMVFHVVKDLDSYREEMLQSDGNALTNWTNMMKKIRDNIIVCNYRFLRNVTPNARDDGWLITGLNHWIPAEYLEAE